MMLVHEESTRKGALEGLFSGVLSVKREDPIIDKAWHQFLILKAHIESFYGEFCWH